MALVLSVLLLPLTTEIGSKGMFATDDGNTGLKAWRNTPGRLGGKVNREAARLMLSLRGVRLGSRTTYAALKIDSPGLIGIDTRYQT